MSTAPDLPDRDRLSALSSESPQPSRRSSAGALDSVASAYTAAYGHPLEHDGLVERERTRRRWSVGLRTALAAGLVLAGIAGAVVVTDLVRASGEPVPLAVADPSAQPPGSDGGGEHLDGSALGDKSTSGPVPGEAQDGAPGAAVAGPGWPGQGADGRVAGPGGEGVDRQLVHVAGQVVSPGVVEVASGARVVDAIDAAGGLTAEADAGAVNLAREVVDGEQVYVPAPGEQVPAAPPGPGAPGPVGATGAGSDGGLVDLNTATAEQLQTLPGIGPALAGRILDWRTDNGAFGAVEELREVAGIGPAVLDKLRDKVTV